MALFSDGSKLVTGSSDTQIKIWEFSTLKCLNTYLGHEESITCLDLTSDNKIIVSCDEGVEIKFWNTETGDCYATKTSES